MFFKDFFYLLLQLSFLSIKSIANKIHAFKYQTQILDMSRPSFLALQDAFLRLSSDGQREPPEKNSSWNIKTQTMK